MCINSKGEFEFNRGDTPFTNLNLTCKWYTYEISTVGMITYPSVGDTYTDEFAVFTVTSKDISLNRIWLFSDNPNQTMFSSQVLRKLTGIGDATITATIIYAGKEIDITGVDIKWVILSKIIDNPTASEIKTQGTILSTAHILPKRGKTKLQLTATNTNNVPIGTYKLFFQLDNALLSQYIGTLDTQAIVVKSYANKL
jgi:hypothetical protein